MLQLLCRRRRSLVVLRWLSASGVRLRCMVAAFFARLVVGISSTRRGLSLSMRMLLLLLLMPSFVVACRRRFLTFSFRRFPLLLGMMLTSIPTLGLLMFFRIWAVLLDAISGVLFGGCGGPLGRLEPSPRPFLLLRDVVFYPFVAAEGMFFFVACALCLISPFPSFPPVLRALLAWEVIALILNSFSASHYCAAPLRAAACIRSLLSLLSLLE